MPLGYLQQTLEAYRPTKKILNGLSLGSASHLGKTGSRFELAPPKSSILGAHGYTHTYMAYMCMVHTLFASTFCICGTHFRTDGCTMHSASAQQEKEHSCKLSSIIFAWACEIPVPEPIPRISRQWPTRRCLSVKATATAYQGMERTWKLLWQSRFKSGFS